MPPLGYSRCAAGQAPGGTARRCWPLPAPPARGSDTLRLRASNRSARPARPGPARAAHLLGLVRRQPVSQEGAEGALPHAALPGEHQDRVLHGAQPLPQLRRLRCGQHGRRHPGPGPAPLRTPRPPPHAPPRGPSAPAASGPPSPGSGAAPPAAQSLWLGHPWQAAALPAWALLVPGQSATDEKSWSASAGGGRPARPARPRRAPHRPAAARPPPQPWRPPPRHPPPGEREAGLREGSRVPRARRRRRRRPPPGGARGRRRGKQRRRPRARGCGGSGWVCPSPAGRRLRSAAAARGSPSAGQRSCEPAAPASRRAGTSGGRESSGDRRRTSSGSGLTDGSASLKPRRRFSAGAALDGGARPAAVRRSRGGAETRAFAEAPAQPAQQLRRAGGRWEETYSRSRVGLVGSTVLLSRQGRYCG